MAKNSDTRVKFIQIIADTPFVNHACKKVGISRATFYRWMKDNKGFRDAVSQALKDGRENTVEIAEAVLLKKMREGDLGATKYYLSFNSERYAPRRAAPTPAINEDVRKVLIEAMRTIQEHQPMSTGDREQVKRALRLIGLIDEDDQITDLFKDQYRELLDEQEKLERNRKKNRRAR